MFWSESTEVHVVLDATVTMNETTRPPTEQLIPAVLEGVRSTAK